jgi:hypothetical protein
MTNQKNVQEFSKGVIQALCLSSRIADAGTVRDGVDVSSGALRPMNGALTSVMRAIVINLLTYMCVLSVLIQKWTLVCFAT